MTRTGTAGLAIALALSSCALNEPPPAREKKPSAATAATGQAWGGTAIAWKSADEGLAAAKAAGRRALVVVSAEWCGHCRNYARVFSDPRVVDQLKFPQYNSFYSRFVVPELRSGSELSTHSWRELEAMFVSLTHVHTIPGDPAIRKTLAGIRPGQVIRFKATLVQAIGPSGGRYSSSLALGDHDCEIAWIDELDLE